VTSDQQRERSGHKRATHNSTPPDPAPSLPAVPAGAGDNPYERFNVRTSDQSITTNNSATMPKTSGAQHRIVALEGQRGLGTEIPDDW
jgi:hypothetical protein